LSGLTDTIVCVSRAVENFVHETEQIGGNKTALIYNCVDTSRFKFSPYPVSGENTPYVIGTIARLEELKGHKYILDALRIIADDPKKEVKLIVLGKGPLRKELSDYAGNLGLENAVTFRGNVSDVPEQIAGFNTVILASTEREGLPLSLLEAMSCGRPVIGTRVGGTPEAVEHGKNGFLVSPKDGASIAKALLTLMDNPDMAEAMGRHGRNTVQEKFSLEIMLSKIAGLYEDVAGKKKKSGW
jgi:glycosyltransferase involved in cell wall biosynthesis